ncbi:MAG: urease accessory protein UreD [Neisseria sp.]|uniref:urease accessory protein UreD n=1 Tax=Neisseria sp. TaxID=192066 RepID=UPI0026DCD7C2|nr:urease accessory protein UreD [Neisseria sp.]MDO4641231.1 urease accessory protein UreD [Neisseria sp.]
MHAKLTLSTQTRNRQTILNNSFATPPLKLLALPPQQHGILHVVQMSSSPGLLAGDVIDTEISLEEHTALSFYTQAFTRVLSMDKGEKAQQRTLIRQAPHSKLCYLPHPLVLHKDSTLIQTTDIELSDGCTLLYGEIIAAGRILNDERFAFAYLSSHLNIRHNGAEVVTDNIQWQPQKYALDVIGQMEHYTHQLNLFYVDTGLASSEIRLMVDQLYEDLSTQFTDNGKGVLWGITQANHHALCLRALSDNAQALQTLMQEAVAKLYTEQVSPLTAAFFR